MSAASPDRALRDAVQDAVDAWLPIGVYLPGSDSARIAEHALAAAGRVLAERLREKAREHGKDATGDTFAAGWVVATNNAAAEIERLCGGGS